MLNFFWPVINFVLSEYFEKISEEPNIRHHILPSTWVKFKYSHTLISVTYFYRFSLHFSKKTCSLDLFKLLYCMYLLFFLRTYRNDSSTLALDSGFQPFLSLETFKASKIILRNPIVHNSTVLIKTF